jgi:hypothetical protein
MASWWATASRSVRAAEPFIRSGARRDATFREIAGAIRAGGLRIGNERLLDALQRERTIVEHGRALRFLGRQQRPAVERLPESLTRLRREFSFAVDVEGTLIATGATRVQAVTVSTDAVLTRQEIEDEALVAVARGESRYGLQATSATIRFGMRAGRMGLV